MQLICRGRIGATGKIGIVRAVPDFRLIDAAVFNRICRPALANAARSYYVPINLPPATRHSAAPRLGLLPEIRCHGRAFRQA